MKINESEILEALASLKPSDGDRPAGAFTSQEGAAAAGLSLKTFMRYLHQLKDAGRLEIVPITITRLDGKPQPIAAYRIRAATKRTRV
ncbi:MAG: hypothetical protein IPL76_10585 [Gemmatimonadetes bacterium]|nr:hypothetical protein [Gemmatimonadota bacterium]